jgi:hypothetical protein
MLGYAPPRPRRPRVRVRKQLPLAPAVVRPTPPAWLLEPQPGSTGRPWWMPPRRRSSGWPGPPRPRQSVTPSDTPRSERR